MLRIILHYSFRIFHIFPKITMTPNKIYNHNVHVSSKHIHLFSKFTRTFSLFSPHEFFLSSESPLIARTGRKCQTEQCIHNGEAVYCLVIINDRRYSTISRFVCPRARDFVSPVA